MDTHTQKRARPRRNKDTVRRAVALLGGLAEVGLIFDISPQAVHKWIKNGVVPAERCRTIERCLGGRITRHELNPDIFGAPPSAK